MSTPTTPKAVVVEGFIYENNEPNEALPLKVQTVSFFPGADAEERQKNATLIVFPGPREEVVLKRDVAAMLRKLPVQALVGEPVVRVQDIEDFFAMHGIHVSDPPTT